MTTMREYVDGIQGEGSWDRMHASINKMEIFGWTMPPVEVDGKTVHIFPGENREVTLEEVQMCIRKLWFEIGCPDDNKMSH